MLATLLDLQLCFTHPDFRRRGAGSMMLQWGTCSCIPDKHDADPHRVRPRRRSLPSDVA